MTREQLKEMGLSDEQIEKVIAENSKDVQSANSRANKNNEELKRLQDVEKEYNDMKNQNLSEIEKANKALEDANKKIADLEKKDAIRSKRANAVSKWKLTSEQAEKVYKDDGSFDDDLLGQIISEKETAAANAKEQEIAKNASNPGGGTGGGGTNNEKPADVANIEGISFGGVDKSAQSARDYYK